MDDEDDEFYAPEGHVAVKSEDATYNPAHTNGDSAVKDEDMEAEDDDNEEAEEEDDDDDDDDSDIDIITERKDGAVPEPPPQARPFRGIKPELPRTASTDNVPPQRNQQQQQPAQLRSETPSQANKVTISLKDGSKYPAVRSSNIDLDAIPTWTPAAKSITDVNLDVDLAENTQLWRSPGTDQTDFFNYGFDEFTWTQYCLKQQTMASGINAMKQETKQFEMMLAGGMPPTAAAPAPPAPGPMGMGAPGGADMPPEMAGAMMTLMQQRGLSDPTQLDFGDVWQFMQSSGGMPGMPGMPGAGGSGGYGAQSMQHQGSQQAFGGQQHGQSSYPHQQQSNQGYGGGTPQPQNQGQQNFSQHNQAQQQPGFEGYSAQQLAMMQGGGPPQGPGGGGRGRGRGRRW